MAAHRALQLFHIFPLLNNLWYVTELDCLPPTPCESPAPNMPFFSLLFFSLLFYSLLFFILLFFGLLFFSLLFFALMLLFPLAWDSVAEAFAAAGGGW